jgi:homoserine kinase
LGAGFDVFGMALELYADVGTGPAPGGAQQIDEHHPARVAFSRLGGRGDIWLRCSIPMARGLGFSGAVRVAAAGLAIVQTDRSISDGAAEILDVTIELEGHGDNVAASLFGGVSACVDDRAIPFPLGPVLGEAAFVAWIPDVTTSTDSSRRSLPDAVSRSSAVHNIGRAAQLVLAFAHDDPSLLVGATNDELHQAARLAEVPGSCDAIEAGVAAGAWCGWLSGSGPTIGFLVDRVRAAGVVAALPPGGHTKILSIDRVGARLLAP